MNPLISAYGLSFSTHYLGYMDKRGLKLHNILQVESLRKLLVFFEGKAFPSQELSKEGRPV